MLTSFPLLSAVRFEHSSQPSFLASLAFLLVGQKNIPGWGCTFLMSACMHMFVWERVFWEGHGFFFYAMNKISGSWDHTFYLFFSARGTTHPPLTPPPPFPLFLTTFTSSPGNFLRSRLSHFLRAQRFLMTSICFLQRSFYS